MQCLMRTTAAGPAGVFQLGKVYDLDPKFAKPLVDGEYAHPVQRTKDGKWEKIPTDDAKPKA